MNDTMFQPSFPNPSEWNDELIAIRQREFADFQKTKQGIAEARAFDDAFAEYEHRNLHNK